MLLEQLQAEQYTLVPPGLNFFVLDIAINAKTSEVIRVLQIDFIEARAKAHKSTCIKIRALPLLIFYCENGNGIENTYVMDYAFHNSTILMNRLRVLH